MKITKDQIITNNKTIINSNGKILDLVGIILPHSSNNIPENFLACDGASYNKYDYSDLYSIIGTTYGGTGDYFNVPDCRGRFLKCRDAESLGTVGIDQLSTHGHVISPNPHNHIMPIGYSASGNSGSGGNAGYTHTEIAGLNIGGINLDISNYGGSETRPKNLYCNYIIRY